MPSPLRRRFCILSQSLSAKVPRISDGISRRVFPSSLYLTGEITTKALRGDVPVYRGSGFESFNGVLSIVSPVMLVSARICCRTRVYFRTFLVFSCLIILTYIMWNKRISPLVKQRSSIAMKQVWVARCSSELFVFPIKHLVYGKNNRPKSQ